MENGIGIGREDELLMITDPDSDPFLSGSTLIDPANISVRNQRHEIFFSCENQLN